jgi:MFS family permease
MTNPDPDTGIEMQQPDTSVECRRSWTTAWTALAIISVSYAAPFPMVIGLKTIQAALGADRSVIALAGALVWVGTGAGGILMGWVAERIGIRATVMIGGVMMALGLVVCTIGEVWALALGNLVLIGVIGNGAIYAPLVIHVSRWFDTRRGTAIALISSGQYISGMVWPSVLNQWMGWFGWQPMFLTFAGVVIVTVVPLALFLTRAPAAPAALAAMEDKHADDAFFGMSRTLAQVLICLAAFLWSVTLSVPTGHLVAFCSDIGIPPAHGAAMLSVLLGSAFLTRPVWGAISDRIGGMRTILIGSGFQLASIASFLATREEAGLFIVASAFGLGFSGILPAYSLTVRELFPASQASWRIPTVLCTAMSGLACGNGLSGLLFDRSGQYGPAFIMGIVTNFAALLLIGFLVARMPRPAPVTVRGR